MYFDIFIFNKIIILILHIKLILFNNIFIVYNNIFIISMIIFIITIEIMIIYRISPSDETSVYACHSPQTHADYSNGIPFKSPASFCAMRW